MRCTHDRNLIIYKKLIKITHLNNMECCVCCLRYNQTSRMPNILSCGHSLCVNCVPKRETCPNCGQKISGTPKPNYSLLQVLKQDTKQIDKFIKVCFVGSSAVGKTSLIRQFMGQEFNEDISTTIGYDFTFKDRIINGYCVRFQLWDSAGQERYRAISPIHYKNSNIIIIVYNVSATDYDNRVSEWIHEAEKHAPPHALKVLVGNKLDLIEGKVCKPLDEEAWRLVKENKIYVYETSCKSGVGIQNFEKFFDMYFQERAKFEESKMETRKTFVQTISQDHLKSEARLHRQIAKKTLPKTKLQKKSSPTEDTSCC